MSLPALSDRIRSSLEHFIATISSPSSNGDSRSRFYHIITPRHRLDGTSLMETVHQSWQANGNTSILMVASNLERFVSLGVADPETPNRLGLLNFSQIWMFLKLNRNHQDDGSTMPGGEYVLPRNILVVFEINPTVPTECALALTGLVEWALDLHREPDTDIRFMTLCTDKDCDFLSYLVHKRYPQIPVTGIDLTSEDDSPIPESTRIFKQNDEEVLGNILDLVREDTGSSHLVISFRDTSLNPLGADLSDDLLKFRNMEFVEEAYELVGSITNAASTKLTWIAVNPTIAVLPPFFKEYNMVHVIGASQTRCCGWDNKSKQLITYHRLTSPEERTSQLWWAQQPYTPQVHFYTEEDNLETFSKGGYCRHRQVENSQLGAFVASVIDLQSWGIDVDSVLNCFVRYPLRITEMTYQLTVQGIISNGQFALRDEEACIFTLVLSYLEYNHHLALFVALDADPNVRKFKLQLAVLLSVGLNVATLDFDKPDPIDPLSDKAKEIFNSCWGFHSDVARQGTMWLTLGLWKCNGRFTDLGLERNDLSSTVYMDQHRVTRIRLHVKNMLRILSEEGILVPCNQPILLESTLGMRQMLEVEKHLFRAYLYQLVSGVRSRPADGQRVFDRIDLTLVAPKHKVLITDVGHSLTSLIDIERILNDSNQFQIFGIGCGMQRHGSSTVLKDWTMIRSEIVTGWMADHATCDISTTLCSNIEHPAHNFDEIVNPQEV